MGRWHWRALVRANAFILASVIALTACQPRNSIGLGESTSVARGALAYRATGVGTRLLPSVELALRFELVVRRLDGRRLREVGRLDLGPPDWDITGLDAASSGPIVWVSSRDGTVRAINVESLEETIRWPVGDSVTSITASADGKYVAYGTSSGVLCLRRTADGALLQCLHAGDDEITSLDTWRDHLASATSGGAVTVWKLPTLTRVRQEKVSGPVGEVAFSRDGSLAVAIGGPPGRTTKRRGEIAAWTADGGWQTCASRSEPVSSITWAESGLLAAGGTGGALLLFQATANGCRLVDNRAFGQPIAYLQTVQPGKRLLVGLWAKGRDEETAVLVDYLYPSP